MVLVSYYYDTVTLVYLVDSFVFVSVSPARGNSKT